MKNYFKKEKLKNQRFYKFYRHSNLKIFGQCIGTTACTAIFRSFIFNYPSYQKRNYQQKTELENIFFKKIEIRKSHQLLLKDQDSKTNKTINNFF